MKAIDTIIFWDAPKDRFPHGRVAIARHPMELGGYDDRRTQDMGCSGGACWAYWPKWLKRYGIKGQLLVEFTKLTAFYGVTPAVVHEAFLGIDEYRAVMPSNMGGPDDY